LPVKGFEAEAVLSSTEIGLRFAEQHSMKQMFVNVQQMSENSLLIPIATHGLSVDDPKLTS
jgi:hypothetical protein